MKQLTTVGIVLSRTNYGEADRIVIMLTRDYGKVHILAKGVRKIRSKLAGGIELCTISSVTYIDGRSNLKTMVSSRLEHNYPTIVRDVQRTLYMYSVLKLLNRTTEDEVSPEYFELLQATLVGLDCVELPLSAVQIWFAIHMLRLSGHMPNLSQTADNQKLPQAEGYTFSFDDMSFVPEPTGGFRMDHIKLLRLVTVTASPLQLRNVQGSAELLESLQKLSDAMLGFYLRP